MKNFIKLDFESLEGTTEATGYLNNTHQIYSPICMIKRLSKTSSHLFNKETLMFIKTTTAVPYIYLI